MKRGCILGLLFMFIMFCGFWSHDVEAQRQEDTRIIEAGAPLPDMTPKYDVKATNVEFTNNGQKLAGILTVPETDAPYPIVILFHGFTGNKEEMLVAGTEETLFGRAARVLAEQGIGNLRFDFLNSGESDGEWPDTTFDGQISDALAALDYVSALPEVDTKKIGILGFSQGGLVGSTVAQDERVSTVVLWAPVALPYVTYSGIISPEDIKRGLESQGEAIIAKLSWGGETQLKTGFFENLYTLAPLAEITKYQGPLMVVIGLKDTVVTPQPLMGSLFMKYHDGPEALVKLNGDHLFGLLESPEVVDALIAWTTDWYRTTFPK